MSQKDFKTFDRFQLPPTRGKKTACQICSKEFKIFVAREHLCKRCGRSVCEDCGSFKAVIFGYSFERKPHRLCKSCQPESEFIKTYVQHYKLQFGQSSSISEKWLKRIGLPQNQQSPNRIDSRKDIVFTDDMFEQLWNSLNFSFRQFIGIVMGEKKPNQISQILYKALQDLAARTEVRLQTHTYWMLFFLSFCSTEQAVKLAYQLIQLAKLQPASKENLPVCLKLLNLSEADRKQMDEYVDYKYRKFCGLLAINCLTFESTLFLMDQLISRRSPAELDRCFAILMFQMKVIIIDNIKSKTDIDVLVIRSMSTKVLEQQYQYLGRLELKKKSDTVTRTASVNLATQQEVLTQKTKVVKKQQQRQIRDQKESVSRGRVSMTETPPQMMEVRRSVSVVDTEDTWRRRVSQLELVIKDMKKKDVQEEPKNFKKKMSTFQDDSSSDSKVNELLSKNSMLEQQLLQMRNRERVLSQERKQRTTGEEQANREAQLRIEELEEKMKRQNGQSSRIQMQLEGKINYLQKQLDLANKEKQQAAEDAEQSKEDVRKYQKQVKSLESSLEMVKMKMETMQLEAKGSLPRGNASSEELDELRKENGILANNLRQKNTKIDSLLKQIKLLDFEMEQQRLLREEAQQAVKDIGTSPVKQQRKEQSTDSSSKPRTPPTPTKLNQQRVHQIQNQNKQLKDINAKLLSKLDELSKTLVAGETQLMQKTRAIFMENEAKMSEQEIQPMQQQRPSQEQLGRQSCRTQ